MIIALSISSFDCGQIMYMSFQAFVGDNLTIKAISLIGDRPGSLTLCCGDSSQHLIERDTCKGIIITQDDGL